MDNTKQNNTKNIDFGMIIHLSFLLQFFFLFSSSFFSFYCLNVIFSSFLFVFLFFLFYRFIYIYIIYTYIYHHHHHQDHQTAHIRQMQYNTYKSNRQNVKTKTKAKTKKNTKRKNKKTLSSLFYILHTPSLQLYNKISGNEQQK